MSRTPILFVWHFHQPDYRDPWSGRPSLPWVRLHACRGYSDLLTAFERGESQWTINWTGTLLEQLQAWNPDEGADTAYRLAWKPARDLTPEEREQLLTISFWANPRTLIEPILRYKSLYAKRGNWQNERNREAIAKSFSHQEIRDLQVLFNLAWCGFTLRQNPLVASLLSKGIHFTEEEKHALLELQAATVKGIIPRYRAAKGKHRLELTISPGTHPILPLLIDSDIAGEALPGEPLPEPAYRHPKTAVKQLSIAIEIHRRIWDEIPRGLWFSEGGVSPAAMELAVAQGFQWTLTDEGILARSVIREITPAERNHPYRYDSANGLINVFFRHRELSDAIGFRYHSWRAETAIADLRERLVKERSETLNEVVTLALDGENAWEAYDDGAERFLTQLAQSFVRETKWRTSTPSDVIAEMEAVPLERLASGSWIQSNFRIWIGDTEKNRAWRQLDRATRIWESLPDAKKPEVDRHLLVAQASDWFWWYGEINRSENDTEFDRLFRGHLARIYELAGESVPADLLEPVRSGITANATMPTSSLQITIDGRETSFYEWQGAGEVDIATHGAIRRSDYPVTRVRFGTDDKKLYFSIDGNAIGNPGYYEIVIHYQKREGKPNVFRWLQTAKPTAQVDFECQDLLEIGFSGDSFQAGVGDELTFRLEISEQGNIVQRVPEFGNVTMQWLGSAEHEAQYWS